MLVGRYELGTISPLPSTQPTNLSCSGRQGVSPAVEAGVEGFGRTTLLVGESGRQHSRYGRSRQAQQELRAAGQAGSREDAA